MLKKYFLALAALMLVLMMTTAAMAESKECNAIPWGESLSAVEEITFSHTAGDIRYYSVNKVEACGIAKIEDTRVTYGFREGKLYATFVEIEKAKDVKRVIALLMDQYGLPDSKKDQGWDIYKWETDTLKVKLKSQYTTDRIKIGMYYKPLMPKKK